MTTSDWDPDQYERFMTQRSQPFWDLVDMIHRGGIERAVERGRQQLRPLDFTARRLRDTGDRDDRADLEARVFADDVAHFPGERPERRRILAEHHERDQFLGLLAPGGRTRDDHLVEVEFVELGDDLLDVVRIIVLAVDDDDVFLATGQHQRLADAVADVAGVEPAVPHRLP